MESFSLSIISLIWCISWRFESRFIYVGIVWLTILKKKFHETLLPWLPFQTFGIFNLTLSDKYSVKSLLWMYFTSTCWQTSLLPSSTSLPLRSYVVQAFVHNLAPFRAVVSGVSTVLHADCDYKLSGCTVYFLACFNITDMKKNNAAITNKIL